jgi:hypothetical protein
MGMSEEMKVSKHNPFIMAKLVKMGAAAHNPAFLY